MNTYVALWGDKEITLDAETTYGAQVAATAVFQAGTRRKVKGHEIVIALTAVNGIPYRQPTTF